MKSPLRSSGESVSTSHQAGIVRSNVWLACAIGLAIFATGVVIWRLLTSFEDDRVQLRTEKTAAVINSALTSKLRSHANALVRQAERIDRNILGSDSSADLALFLRDFRSVLAVRRSVAGDVVLQIARPPLTGESLFRFLPASHGDPEVTTGGYVRTLSSPARIEDGRLSYFMTYQRAQGDAPSILTAALDARAWFSEAFEAQPNYDVAIEDEGNLIYDVHTDGTTQSAFARYSQIKALGRTWKTTVVPTRALLASEASPLPSTILVTSFLFALTTAVTIYFALIARDRRRFVAEANAGLLQHIERQRVAEASRDVARRELGSILESITDAFFIVDGNWNYVYANDAAGRSIGKRPSEMIGHNMWSLHSHFSGLEDAERIRSAMRERTTIGFERHKPNGQSFFVRVYPHLEGLALSFHDITETRRTAVRLTESEALLRQAQAVAHVGSFVRAVGEKTEQWSVELCRIVGEGGDSDAMAHSPFIEFVHPDDRERVQVLETELHMHSTQAETKARVVRANGETHPVRIRMHLDRDELDAPASLVVTVQDITEQEHAEAALSAALSHSRQQSAKFRALNRAMLLISAKLGHPDLHQVLVEELREAVSARVAMLDFVSDDILREPLLSAQHMDPAESAQVVVALNRFSSAMSGKKVLRLTRAEVQAHPAWLEYASTAPSSRPAQGLLCVPLHDRMGTLLGFLSASDRYDDDFTADDEAIAIQFAQIASVAIGWASLIDDLRSAETHLSEHLLEVQRSKSLLAEAEHVAKLGSWELVRIKDEQPDFSLSEQAAWMLRVGHERAISLEALVALAHPDDASRVRSEFLTTLNGTSPALDFEFRLRFGKNTRWIHAKGQVINETMGVPRVVGSMQDITNAHINAIQDRLTAHTFAGIAAGIRLEDSLSDVIELYENRFPDGMCSALLVDDEKRLHTAAAPNLPLEYSMAIDGLQAAEGAGSCGTAAWRGERVMVRDTLNDPLWKDYTTIAKRFGLLACWSTPIMDRTGSVMGTFAVYYREQRDPSQEEIECVDHAAAVAAVAISAHQSRQRIEDREQRFRSLFTYVPEAIFALDMQGRVVDCNEAALRMSGFSRENLIDRSLDLTVVPEARKVFAAHVALAASGAVQQIELQRQRPDGSRYITVSIKTPIFVNGVLVGIFAIVRDVTEERANRLALEDALRTVKAHNRELEEFAFVASHDLQEPLRKVRAFGDRLRMHLSGSTDTAALDFIARMRDAAERMQRLIGDLLAYSRIAKRDTEIKPVDLNVVLKGVLIDLETRIEQSGANIQYESLPTLQAEETQMRQLLQNLISNALKFSRAEAPPVIKLRGEVSQPTEGFDRRAWVSLEVSDNGIGFDTRHAERIFGAFQRLHGRGEYEGSGIGLAIVRRIAERHGGRVFARGMPGEGATFTVELPQSVSDVSLIDAAGGNRT